MKKTIMFLIVALLGLYSCSNNDEAGSQESTILPKKVVYIFRDSNSETLFSYDGNKLLEMNSNYISTTTNQNRKTKVIYNGDLIIKTEDFKDNLINSSGEYTYENNKLKTALIIYYGINQTPSHKIKKEYTYNQDGTMLIENYNININTGLEMKNDNSKKYTFENGNVTKIISITSNFNGNNTIYYRYTSIYEYDNKINPFKNVVGFGKINEDYYSKNNISKATISYETSSDKITYSPPSLQNVTNYNLIYQSNNFLKESNNIEIIPGSTPESFTNIQQYFY
jgi:hypothetical protein